MNERFAHFGSDARFQSVRGWYTTVQRQPSWVVKFAAAAAALMIIVPIALLVLAAVLTFVLVFTVLSLAHRAGDAIRSLFVRSGAQTWPDDGRRGVRVITAEFRPNE